MEFRNVEIIRKPSLTLGATAAKKFEIILLIYVTHTLKIGAFRIHWIRMCCHPKKTMSHTFKNLSRDVIINNDLGLHARSAAKIAQLAQNATAKVWIIRDNEKVDAKSIIDLLTLACAKGTKITLQIDDPVDFDILDSILHLIERGFGE